MDKSPLVIVGTGGSGTRVFARLAAATGRHMGAHLNEANDAMALYWLANRWCGEIYTAWKSEATINVVGFEAELKPCLEAHLVEVEPGAPWGWKQPRSLYLLPALAAVYPELRVIHVIRDGRDIAFGKRSRLDIAGNYAVPADADEQPVEVKLALMWDGPNRLAADFGERELGECYLRLRLEDACADPEVTAQRLAAFADGVAIGPAQLGEIISTPPTLGRWRDQDPELLASVESAAEEGLRRFGYSSAAEFVKA